MHVLYTHEQPTVTEQYFRLGERKELLQSGFVGCGLSTHVLYTHEQPTVTEQYFRLVERKELLAMHARGRGIRLSIPEYTIGARHFSKMKRNYKQFESSLTKQNRVE